MLCSYPISGRHLSLTALALMLAVRTSHATTINHVADASDLVGAEISVTFAQSGLQTATVALGSEGQAIASIAGSFDFSTNGGWESQWRLKNSTSFDTILSVQIDLSNTTSLGTVVEPGPHTPGTLFDTSGSPSTLKSRHGRPGVKQHNRRGPSVVSSFETMPWEDPMNMGDMFIREIINYQNFGPGRTSVWFDDIDIVGGFPVPEPNSAMLLILSVGGLLSRMRRSSFVP
jgi:hypothetical protein